MLRRAERGKIMIRYTEQERDLMNSTTIRGYLVLKKLARLVGDEQREPIVSIPTESFIGQGYDQKDMDRISGVLSEMTEIIFKFRFVDNRLDLAFQPEARELVRKLALEPISRPKPGDGELYCRAALALKRKMGVKSAVFYQLANDFEEFDHGEDVSYLDRGFGPRDPWSMRIEGACREIEFLLIMRSADYFVEIEQIFSKGDACESVTSRVARMDFINPYEWENWMGRILREGRELLEKKGWLN